MEIIKDLQATEEELNHLEMHSVVNILSVIQGQLDLIRLESDYGEILQPAINKVAKFQDAVSKKDTSFFSIANLQLYAQEIFDSLEKLRDKQGLLKDGSDIREYVNIFENIFDVFEERMYEILKRWEEPGAWVPFDIDSFIVDFKEFFFALEKNSRGRYKIIYNIADQQDKDYLIHFAIDSEFGKVIYLPLLLKDVIRDLIANARKYTQPGGDIDIGISLNNKIFKFVVEDTGYGIPPEEIPYVVDYGYRATNVTEKVRTMGGGYGLTKAFYVTKQLGGKMWIDSDLDEGTKIKLEIPIPDKVYT